MIAPRAQRRRKQSGGWMDKGGSATRRLSFRERAGVQRRTVCNGEAKPGDTVSMKAVASGKIDCAKTVTKGIRRRVLLPASAYTYDTDAAHRGRAGLRRSLSLFGLSSRTNSLAVVVIVDSANRLPHDRYAITARALTARARRFCSNHFSWPGRSDRRNAQYRFTYDAYTPDGEFDISTVEIRQ